MAFGTGRSSAAEEPWFLQRKRNKTVMGTWEDCAFQVSLRYREIPEDPVAVPLFSDLLPYHCLPHCGVYGPEDYHVALPLVVITLPSEPLVGRGSLFSALPHDLQHHLDQKPVFDPSLLDFSILVHSRPSFEGSLNPHAKEINLMMHTWALQGMDFAPGQEVHITMEMGVFAPEGVYETAQDICEELNGVAVGRTGRRILHMHAMSFSPHNAQLALTDNYPLHSFLSLARHNSRRTAITYHIVPSTEVVEGKIKEGLRESRTVGDLLRSFGDLGDGIPGLSATVSVMNRLISAAIE